MNYQREPLLQMIDEMMPLIKEHYLEIAHFQDIPLEPDIARYVALEKAGSLYVYTARDDAKKLIGYALFIVNKNLHYASSVQAHQDIIFIRKENRGTGGRLIKFCDEELTKLGVQAVYHHVKTKHNFGALLERMGYEAVDVIYTKRLDLGGK